jgi:hypothetical protein
LPGGEARPELTIDKVSDLVHKAVERSAQGMRVYPELDPMQQ